MIMNENKMKQLIDFDGLSSLLDKRTGSDIDFMWESRNDGVFVVGEVKQWGKQLPTGQIILLRNLVDMAVKSGMYKKAVALLLWHKTEDPSTPIPIEKCKIAASYTQKSDKKNALNFLDLQLENYIFGEMWDKIKSL